MWWALSIILSSYGSFLGMRRNSKRMRWYWNWYRRINLKFKNTNLGGMPKYLTIWLSPMRWAIFMRKNNICRTFKKWTKCEREVIINSTLTHLRLTRAKMSSFTCLNSIWMNIRMKMCIHLQMDQVGSIPWTSKLLRDSKWAFQKKKKKATSATLKWVMTRKTR